MDFIDKLDCLVVDDEPRLRQVLLHLMRNEGFRCFEACNGVEAIEVLERQPIPLVMSDMRMPRMDGIELLKRIRQRWPDTAVLIITAVSEVETAVSCLSMGAMDYLTKPFHLEEVRARVKQALEKRQLILENRSYQDSLEKRVAAQAKRLEELFLGGVQTLAEALEAKDPYTRGHSVRVGKYARIIARTLELDEETIRQIELGGNVHDIGKIGVREDVLWKPGSLTPEEYDHMRTHPVTGWRILSPMMSEGPIALNVVRSHHERVDGTGFPDGLSGDQIPLEARIVAVADTLDAMTSGRPYRADQGLADALSELARHCGTQFDSRVVDATRRAVENGELTLLPRPSVAEPLVSV
jgi:response regulator RpfG family c-di-GMP phosphodiesterase